MLEIVVSALEPPRSAVGMAHRVHLAAWSGPGTDSIRADLSAILGRGANGEPLQVAVEAWPPPEPVRVVRASERPEVVIQGAVVVAEESLANDDAGCATRTVLVSVSAEAHRLVGDEVTDRLRWNMALRDKACGGLGPRSSTELVEALLRGIAPEIAGLVVPRWTASEMALATSPTACLRGNTWAETKDLERAARFWGAGEEFPACAYNLGVKAVIEGDIAAALRFYDLAAEQGAPTADAVAKARKRALELEALGWAASEEPLPPAPAPAASLWTPEEGLTLSVAFTRHPTLGRSRERLSPLVGSALQGQEVGSPQWHSTNGIDRGFSVAVAYHGEPISAAGGLSVFPGDAPVDQVDEFFLETGSPVEELKLRSAGWLGVTPLTLSGEAVSPNLLVCATLSVGVGGLVLEPITLLGLDPDGTVVIPPSARWELSVAPVVSGAVEIGLDSYLSLRFEGTWWRLLAQPSVPVDPLLTARSVGLSYRF